MNISGDELSKDVPYATTDDRRVVGFCIGVLDAANSTVDECGMVDIGEVRSLT